MPTRLACWLLLAALCAPLVAMAQRVEGEVAAAQGVYEAEVPVRDQTEGERENGLARALVQVLSKLSGERQVANRAGVGRELRRAANYVEGYDYRQDRVTGPSGAPTFRTMMVVRFDPAQIDAVAGALGLPVWPQPRPRPVLWLAIDDGRGPRLVGLEQSNAARPLLNRAIERGFRLGLPAGNAAEMAAAGAIWRGDTAAIARLSARYNPPMQLIGKLYRHEGAWKADWIFLDNGRELSRWSQTHADARSAMATGADGSADALSRRYAKADPAAQPAVQRVVFTGVRGGADYIRLASTLQRMSVVRGMRLLRASDAGLEVELDLLSGMAGFRRIVDDQVLVEVESPGALLPVYQLR